MSEGSEWGEPSERSERSERSDWYRTLTTSAVGAAVTRRLGLPRPAVLRRWQPGQPLLAGPLVVGTAGPGQLADHVQALATDGATADPQGRVGAVVLDATGAATVADLAAAQEFLTPAVRRLAPSGRLLVLAGPPEEAAGVKAGEVEAAAVRRALEGLVRSAGKELRAGATANLVYLAESAPPTAADSTVRFLLSARSAYVSGQVVRVGPGNAPPPADPDRPLRGRVAVVTGAARGIGAAIAEVLARDGAGVVCVDLPAQGEALAAVANRVRGSALQLDLTAADAPARLIGHLSRRHGRADVVVHNAGVIRDRLLANMDPRRWTEVLAVNLAAPLRITEALTRDGTALGEHARIVCVSSVTGIAGNRGQTNYAASKAGIIGMVAALAPRLADRGTTINAVAPGFIETEMTAAMPLPARELGRRINSLNQGGLPVDVAETVAWLGQAASGGVTGQVVRVCGQSMLGA